MRKFLTVCCILWAGAIVTAETSKYKIVKIEDKEVYFSKMTSEYLEELFSSKDKESFYEIAMIYMEMEKPETAYPYIKEYAKHIKTEEEYKKVFDFYSKTARYTDEIELIEKYIENKPAFQKEKYYEKINMLINEKNILTEKKYEISKYEVLKSLEEEPYEYYKYFYLNNWTEEEKEKISQDLNKKEIEENYYIKKVFFETSDRFEIEKFYYSRIKSIEDRDGYFLYFKILDELEMKPYLRDKYEILYYYNYTKDENKFNELYNSMLIEFIKTKNYDEMKKLYFTDKNFKVLYNIALAGEDYFYEFIKQEKNNEKIISILINKFYEMYPKSEYIREIKKIEFFNLKDENKKITIADEILNFKFSKDIFEEKLKCLWNIGEKVKFTDEIRNFIFTKQQYDDYIKIYIEMLEENNGKEELYLELQNFDNKIYFIEFCLRNKRDIPKEYEKELFKYYMNKKMYTEVLKYNKYMGYEEYKKVIDEGNTEYIEEAAKKYPEKKEWMNLEEIKNFYFSEYYHKYDMEIISKLIIKENKNDAEIFYLAKYYNFIGEFEESQNLLEKIINKYKMSQTIKELKIKNENKNQEEEI